MLTINWSIKKFEELTIHELYSILQLREEVFVIEQECFYTDMDDKDQTCIHIMGYHNGKIVAYARIFPPQTKYEHMASFGRVLVAKSARGTGSGKELIANIINYISKEYDTSSFKISAQFYLTKFYEEFGFTAIGKTYLDAGVEHIDMIKP